MAPAPGSFLSAIRGVSASGGNTPRALFGAGADGHPKAPDRRPLGACPYRRQCAECSPPKFIGGLSRTVMGEPRACCLRNVPRIVRTVRALAHEASVAHAAVPARGANQVCVNAERRAKRLGTPNLRGGMQWALGMQLTYHGFRESCCATILRFSNTTFISCQQMFLNAETPSMVPGFVREVNHAF